MDVKRLLLLIPLAVLAYLLVVQWNQDYGQPNYDSVPETTQRSNSASPGNAEDGEGGLAVPSTSSQQSAVGEGIPDTESETSSRDFVAVTTDVLDVRIDPHGGDIVYAALPQHKLSSIQTVTTCCYRITVAVATWLAQVFSSMAKLAVSHSHLKTQSIV